MRSWSGLAYFLAVALVSAYFRMYYLSGVSMVLFVLLIVGWGEGEFERRPDTTIGYEDICAESGCGSGNGRECVCGKGGGGSE